MGLQQRCLHRTLEQHLQPAVMQQEGRQLPDMVLLQMETPMDNAIRRWVEGEDVDGASRHLSLLLSAADSSSNDTAWQQVY